METECGGWVNGVGGVVLQGKLDKIYLEDLRFDSNSLKKIIIDNPDTYIASPIELQKIIDYMKEQGYTIEIIREFILKNSKIISMTSENFIKALKKN